MRPNSILSKIHIKTPKPELQLFQFPKLSEISYKELPNNGFGINNYYIPKTKFNHWPVYIKIQNTKITTEIKRVEGDLLKLRQDLLNFNPNYKLTINSTAGIINIKGDVVEEIKSYLDKNSSST